MGSKLYSLTPEHRAQLRPWAEKWIANAMSVSAMTENDRVVCRDAVKRLYRAAKIEPPPDHRIVFVPSPFVLRFAGGFASWIWYCRAKPGAATDDATRAATDDATDDGKILNRKQTYQFFETPDALASRMARMAEIQPQDAVLEPSAGGGVIARAIVAEQPECVLNLVEIDANHRAGLAALNPNTLIIGDFLREPTDGEFFDRIVMNPPFNNGQDIAHIRHAYGTLRLKGKLVAILSTSALSNADRRSLDFRGWLEFVGYDSLDDLPPGTFGESGTEVASHLLVMTK